MRHLDPGPALCGDHDGPSQGRGCAHGAGQAGGEDISVVGSAGRQEESSAVLAHRCHEAPIQALCLIDVAGHEHSARGIPAALDVSLQGSGERMVVAEHLVVVDHHQGLPVLADQLGELWSARCFSDRGFWWSQAACLRLLSSCSTSLGVR